MHAILKKINDKFVVEWNKDSKPVNMFSDHYIDEKSNMYLNSKAYLEWQKNTKIVEFATYGELEKTLTFTNLLGSDCIDVSDCIEIREVELFDDYLAYFKEPVK